MTDTASHMDTVWQDALEQQRLALAAYVAGDPAPFRASYSHAADVTVFGGFGGWQKGWRDIEERTSWSSSQYHGGSAVPELLAQGHSGDLGFTVHLEHIAAQSGPSATEVQKTYRVTHIFRREGDEWKLIHRHADPLIETNGPK
jgi:ketosteroid isomerase-like protein